MSILWRSKTSAYAYTCICMFIFGAVKLYWKGSEVLYYLQWKQIIDAVVVENDDLNVNFISGTLRLLTKT